MKKYIIIFFVSLVLAAVFYLRYTSEPREDLTVFETAEKETASRESAKKDIEVVAGNLQVPWEIVFLPDGDILITERTGTLRRIGEKEQVFDIEDAAPVGEGGEGDKVVELKKHFQGEFGRIRAVVLGPDGFIYISTSNRDGRGRPQ